jgi:xanthine dehydrogenase YagS FAD-binding subunit
MLRDMIPAFELLQPTDLGTALTLLERHDGSWVLAGGYDSLDWFKDRAKQPGVVVDLERIEELAGIRETPGGIEIGAMTTLTAVERHPMLREEFSLLADAARVVASPQIRNAATLGGNVCQDTRCWYYRYGLSCYRAGGNVCYAATPVAMNREHCIFGASRCVAVSPSDLAPALVALDAQMVIQSARGARVLPAEDFFMKPSVDITRMTVLDADELLTAVRISDTWRGRRFYFEKVADRNAFDFSLASVAAAVRLDGDRIEDARIACGGVQCIPRRLLEVEDFVRGRVQDEETAATAGRLAVRDAEPLNYNHFKIPLLENLVRRALRGS